jgi:ribosomal-protein-alanine N-acetyltransferase
MSGFVVRAAGAADLAEVMRLERRTVEAPHWGEAEYAAIAGEPGGAVRRCFFVAEMEARVVGFAVGKAVGLGAGGFAELESVAVDAAARRMGMGEALCGAVIAWSRRLGVGELELEVRAGSEGAIALYRGLGFVEVGRRSGYYREPMEDALLMRLELARGE